MHCLLFNWPSFQALLCVLPGSPKSSSNATIWNCWNIFLMRCGLFMALATCQPSYLYNLLQVYHPSRALHSSTQQLLHVPYISTDFGRHAFSYSSPATGNSIPISIKNCSSLYSFKRHLKSHFIAQLINN